MRIAGHQAIGDWSSGRMSGVEEGSGRVMLVVPFAIERAGLRTIIESSSLHQVVAEAAVGDRALQLAAETKPDIAVIDYSVPEITGLGLAHMLARNHPQMSILLYCDNTTEELIVHAIGEGVRGFVLKSDAGRHLVPALDALSDHRPYWDDAVDEEVFTRLMGGPPVPPIHMPLRFDAATLSRMRSLVTSRSNCANESRTFSVSRPMLVVVLKACVTLTNEAPDLSSVSTIRAKSTRQRVSRSTL